MWSEESDTTLIIYDLPVGVWTEKIEAQLKNPKSKLVFDKVEESHTDTTVSFTITGVEDMDKMVGALKLVKTVRENYVVFQDGHLIETNKKDIIDYHFKRRLDLYEKRKGYQLNTLIREKMEMENKMKFIQVCIEGKIPLTHGSNVQLLEACMVHNVDEKYLDMNLRDLTLDKVNKLKAKMERTSMMWDRLNKTSVEDIWLKELNDLERCINPAKKKRDYIDLSD